MVRMAGGVNKSLVHTSRLQSAKWLSSFSKKCEKIQYCLFLLLVCEDPIVNMSIWMADWTELNWIDWLTGQMSKAISPISIVCSVYDFLILVRTQSASQSDDCSLIGNLWRKQIVRSLFHYFWNPIWRITNCPQMGSQYRQTQSETEEGDWDKILMAADDMWLSLYVSINRLQSMTISMGSYKLWESVSEEEARHFGVSTFW